VSSRRRILVTDFVRGDSFETFAAHASREAKDQAGLILMQFAFESLVRHRMFNADPHPGNCLFVGDRVAFLDFGCVKRLEVDAHARLVQSIRAHLERDFETARSLWLEMGGVSNEQRYDFEHHRNIMLAMYEPWLHDEPFRFTWEFVERLWKMLLFDNPNRFVTSVPKDSILTLACLRWGLYAVLARLEARADFRGSILDLLYAPGEERPEPF